MNEYFVYQVIGDHALDYMEGSDYIGVWSKSITEASRKVRNYFKDEVVLIPTKEEDVKGDICYLY